MQHCLKTFEHSSKVGITNSLGKMGICEYLCRLVVQRSTGLDLHTPYWMYLAAHGLHHS